MHKSPFTQTNSLLSEARQDGKVIRALSYSFFLDILQPLLPIEELTT